MTKAERLLFLIDLIRRRKSVTVPEMGRATGVSSRTIFRDIASLSRMNVPIYFDNGYRIARDTKIQPIDLSDSELELLRHCLRFNPLAEYPYFSERCLAIEQKIIHLLRREGSGPVRCLIGSETRRKSGETDRHMQMREQFLRALFERRKIALVLDNVTADRIEAAPVRLLQAEGETTLVISGSDGSEPLQLPLEKVRSLSIVLRSSGTSVDSQVCLDSPASRKSLTRTG